MSTQIISPRDYQEEAIRDNFHARNQGDKRVANTHATGLGKTVMFSWISYLVATDWKQHSGRTLIIVHLDELVNQAVAKVHAVAPALRVGVIKRKRHEIEDMDVIVASVQSLGRADMKRLNSMSPFFFEWIIVDECHHSVAPSYQRILAYFGAFDPNHPVMTSGFTATLSHNDGGLGQTYQRVLESGKDILWGIENGYLVDVKGKRITLDNLNLSSMKASKQGDYSEERMGAALTAADYAPIVAHGLTEYAPDRQMCVFSPTVAVAHEVSEALHSRGRTNAIVTGATSLEDRALIYKRFRRGEYQDLVNCRVFVEGFDMPQLGGAVIPPTRNPNVFIQEAGRALRPYTEQDVNSPYLWIRKEKTDALLLLVGDGHTQLASLPDLSEFTKGRQPEEDESLHDLTERIVKEEKTKGKIIDLGRLRVEDVDFFAKSQSAWLRTKDKEYWFIQTKDWIVAMYPQDTSETLFMVGQVWCGKGKKQKGGTLARNVNLEYGKAWAESVAFSLDSIGTYAKKDASWRKTREPITTAQKNLIRMMGIKGVNSQITKHEASDIISIHIASAALDKYVPPEAKPTEVEEETDDE
jgi:superfamily II DNA or RNA helicase